ncbi:GMC oxidoreductase [Simkania sp.]|uniref:GMC oxidoreductase n=1 Tax=Simkania sp. TaxID=34094 RepID=UPI003B5265B3
MTDELRHALESPLKNLVEKSSEIDVLIIGSGTAGVTTALALAEKKLGLKIAILEAGPLTLLSHVASSPLKLNERAVSRLQDQITYKTTWCEQEQNLEPNTTGWATVGGRTLLWRGNVPRFRPEDFHDWPFTYEQFEPYYSRAEKLLSAGSFVHSQGQDKLIQDLKEEGFNFRASSVAIDSSCSENGILPVGFNSSIARLVRSDHLVTFGESPGISLTSEVEVRSLEKNGKRIEAVHVEDQRTQTSYVLSPKNIVVAAGGIQSVRLVMASKIEENKDVLGCYINDHLFAHTFFKKHSGVWEDKFHLYSAPTAQNPFHFQLCGPLTREKMEFHQSNLATLPTRWVGWNEPGNYLECEIFGRSSSDRNKRLVLIEDGTRLPSCKVIHPKSQEDLAVLAAMKNGTKKLAAAMDSELLDWTILSVGIPMHDSGGLRMGTDPETSIVNPSGKFWRIDNLSVADASTWPSQGSANPYLTITAWALKQADELELK